MLRYFTLDQEAGVITTESVSDPDLCLCQSWDHTQVSQIHLSSFFFSSIVNYVEHCLLFSVIFQILKLVIITLALGSYVILSVLLPFKDSWRKDTEEMIYVFCQYEENCRIRSDPLLSFQGYCKCVSLPLMKLKWKVLSCKEICGPLITYKFLCGMR